MRRSMLLVAAAALGCSSGQAGGAPPASELPDAALEAEAHQDGALADVSSEPGWSEASVEASGEAAQEASAPICQEPEPDPNATTEVLADLGADLSNQARFYDFPFPSDLRLASGGTPDLSGFPRSLLNKVVNDLLLLAQERHGFPVIPVAWFRFTGALAALENASEQVIPAHPQSPVLLLDIDPASPERGRLIPTVVSTPKPDGNYVPANLLTVAAVPGFVLAPIRKYAFVIMRGMKDGAGRELRVAPSIAALMKGQAPAGAKGEAARALYAPLLETLEQRGMCANQVAAATVFTTSDVVSATAVLSTAVAQHYQVTVDSLGLDPDDGASHEHYCELHGTVVYPQFQKGTPPFNTYGRFDMSQGPVPVWQRNEAAPVVINLPRGPMPKGGYPLLVFFHGSGGRSTAVVDRGLWRHETDATQCPEGTLDSWEGKSGCFTKGMGPAHYHGRHGIATAGSALPLNPERYPGAKETEYLNLLNLAAFRDTFRQGVLEQRLFIEALRTLQVPPEAVAACSGISLPEGETAYHFRSSPVLAQGQSMGGMYTNMLGAVEPRIEAVIPTGAGGYWSYFILKGNQVPGGAATLSVVLGTKGTLTFMHPAMHLLELAWEAAEPIVYMPRLARRPLPAHPVRAIYEPVGKDDSYFPTAVFDATALAYGNTQAGEQVWPSMQPALALDGLGGMTSYPVKHNRTSEDGTPYTGVVVQYAGDGVYDPHALYTQLDAVKYQYGCFAASFLKTGVGTVPAPADMTTPCPP